MDDERIRRVVEALRGKEKIKILFVCLGNICRSPAAEGIMRHIVAESGDAGRWVIDSAGTGEWHVGDLPDRRMRIHARRRGIELDHVCRQVSEADFDRFDLIIGMDAGNIADLRRLASTPEAQDKIVAMSAFVDAAMRYDHIPDPYYDGADGFETVLDLLQNGLGRLYEALS